MKVTAKVLIIVTILLLNSTFLCACGSKKKPDTAAQPSVFEISSAEQEEASPGGQNDSAADQKASTDKDAISELLAKGSNINEICYDLIIIGAGISSETKVWFKNKKMKIDSLLNGKRTFYIFDLEKDEIISYLPGEDMATKQRSYEYTGTDSITPMDLASFLNNNDYKLMGTQTVNGMECQLLTVNTDEGNF
ncbi:MAG: DUF4412 domain-containing protein, partial [Peptococcaceae bacterium]|nr:DUF4412 domain-containing protein [Peptococcaceae bacterium]